MKVGVTGGNGFIGRYACEELVARGHEVVVFDSHGRAGDPSYAAMIGDIRDDTAMTELAAHVDAIMHLAAVLGTQETIGNPRPAALTNVVGGLNFLEACTQYDLPGVYIGVGNHWMNNTYSITKTTVERFVHMFNKERGSRVNVVRAVNAYGPRQAAAAPFGCSKVRKITPAVVCRALSGLPVELYGGGHQVSDMVWVGDVARTLVAALERAAEGTVLPSPVEIGPTTSTTIREMATLAIDKCVARGYPEVGIVDLPMRPGENIGDVVAADTATLLGVGIDPEGLVDLDEGLDRTVDWFVEAEGSHWLRPASSVLVGAR